MQNCRCKMRFCVTSAEATYAKQNMAESNTDDKALRMNVGGDKKSRHIEGVIPFKGHTLLYIGIVCCSGHLYQREF